jgi:hypothetical protein
VFVISGAMLSPISLLTGERPVFHPLPQVLVAGSRCRPIKGALKYKKKLILSREIFCF